jgi:hypothetical protein
LKYRSGRSTVKQLLSLNDVTPNTKRKKIGFGRKCIATKHDVKLGN